MNNLENFHIDPAGYSFYQEELSHILPKDLYLELFAVPSDIETTRKLVLGRNERKQWFVGEFVASKVRIRGEKKSLPTIVDVRDKTVLEMVWRQ
jgi:hypothetical protein